MVIHESVSNGVSSDQSHESIQKTVPNEDLTTPDCSNSVIPEVAPVQAEQSKEEIYIGTIPVQIQEKTELHSGSDHVHTSSLDINVSMDNENINSISKLRNYVPSNEITTCDNNISLPLQVPNSQEMSHLLDMFTSEEVMRFSAYSVLSFCHSHHLLQKLVAWRDAKPPPKTAEEATRLVIHTLKRHQKADVEGLLAFYRLPSPQSLETGKGSSLSPTKPDGVKYKLHTLPVDRQSISDGGTITVYVDTADARESMIVPPEVREAATKRAKVVSVKDYKTADALHKSIVDAGYKVISSQNGNETLAKKYRIRLRGIDAPETAMPFGKEAKEELVKLCEGKRLTVLIYFSQQYKTVIHPAEAAKNASREYSRSSKDNDSSS